MADVNEHAVGLRELRHNTGDVIARVRHGETIDITEYGRPIARIVPVADRTPAPIMTQLVQSGRAQLAIRPGYRPKMRRGDGSNRLGEALEALREEQTW